MTEFLRESERSELPTRNRRLVADEAMRRWVDLHCETCSRPWVHARFELRYDPVEQGWYYHELTNVYPPGGPTTAMQRCPDCVVWCPPNLTGVSLCVDCEDDRRTTWILARVHRAIDTHCANLDPDSRLRLHDAVDDYRPGLLDRNLGNRLGMAIARLLDGPFEDYLSRAWLSMRIDSRNLLGSGASLVQGDASLTEKAVNSSDDYAIGCEIRILGGGSGSNPDEMGDDPLYFREGELGEDENDTRVLREEIRYFLNSGRVMEWATFEQLEEDRSWKGPDRRLANKYKGFWRRDPVVGWIPTAQPAEDEPDGEGDEERTISDSKWEVEVRKNWRMEVNEPENWLSTGWSKPEEASQHDCHGLTEHFNKLRKKAGRPLIDPQDPTCGMTRAEFLRYRESRGW